MKKKEPADYLDLIARSAEEKSIPFHAYQILVSDHYLDDQGHLQLS